MQQFNDLRQQQNNEKARDERLKSPGLDKWGTTVINAHS